MNKTKIIALCGVLAALAIVIMCLGGLMPFMTYVCPVFCICITQLITMLCNRPSAWTWYSAVCILSLLLCPDKEAAAIFIAFGYYPMVKQKLDRLPINWFIKIIYFNAVTLIMYWLMMNVFGMEQIIEDFSSLGTIMTVVTLFLGNLVFVMIDKILERMNRKLK